MPWLRTWLLALAMVSLSLTALEVAWRSGGYFASVTDDKDLWAYERSRLYSRGTDTLVSIGFSRIRTDLAIDTFRADYPAYDVVQLAVNGRHPLATLEDLAMDEDFNGIVLCSVIEMSFMPNAPGQRPWIDHYHRSQPLARLDRAAMVRIEVRLVLLNEDLNLVPVAGNLARRGRLQRPRSGVVRPDRSVVGEMPAELHANAQRGVLVGQQFMYKLTWLPTPNEWIKLVSSVEPWVERIRSRGGRVVFLRVPVAPPLYALDQSFFPKHKYWDRIAQGTSAVTIHFQDVEGMAEFEFPDYSHMNSSEARRFTPMLTDELVRRGVLRPPDAAVRP
jgi:hypothetical protein